MPDILHDLPIAAPCGAVFTAISSPAGLDAWWTLGATGEARVGADYELFFGEEYDWRARARDAMHGGSRVRLEHDTRQRRLVGDDGVVRARTAG